MQPPSGGERVTHARKGGASKCIQGRKGRTPDRLSRRCLGTPFLPTEWQDTSRIEHLLKQNKGGSPLGFLYHHMSRRHVGSVIRAQLATIEPNPGPGNRRGWRRINKTEEKLERRRERRREKRRTRARERENEITHNRPAAEDIVEIVTWNVQGLSLKENNRRRLRRVLALIEKKNGRLYYHRS